MATTKSAEKRVKVIRRRTLRNKILKSALRTAIRKFEHALKNNSRAEAEVALRNALVAIDKAVSKGILHKNNAARKKSRFTKRFNRQAS